ncbi:MAG TPA: tol-pal system protein YbgF [Steroidobacteraceae bacterium]|nr:tol-pal system protein YbgF [Steroidobacteraceae bacterium]
MAAALRDPAFRLRTVRCLCGLGLLLLGGLVAGCETEPPQPDPTVVRLNDVDQRLGRVERVVSNQSLVQLSQHVDQLDTELRELRGEIEELQNANDTLVKQQHDYYADLDRRVGALETAVHGGGAAAGAPPPIGGNGAASPPGAAANLPAAGGGAGAVSNGPGAGNGGQASAQSAYDQAFDTLKGGNYAAAVMQFMQFLQDFPSSDLDDNAQYWLGESYYVMRDYDNAAVAFRTVGEKYPQSRKAPDALLKLGYTQLDQQKNGEGRATLQLVLQRFPMSDAAKLAMQRLAQLPQGSP